MCTQGGCKNSNKMDIVILWYIVPRCDYVLNTCSYILILFITNVLHLLIVDLLQKWTKLHLSIGDFVVLVTTKCFAITLDQLKLVKEHTKDLLKTTYYHHVMVNIKSFPFFIILFYYNIY